MFNLIQVLGGKILSVLLAVTSIPTIDSCCGITKLYIKITTNNKYNFDSNITRKISTAHKLFNFFKYDKTIIF